MSREAGYSSDTSERGQNAVPDLDDVAGKWIAAAELEHPSVVAQPAWTRARQPRSLLTLVAGVAPYSFGYHTGLLRLDGAVLPTQLFRWKPREVRREYYDA